MPFKSPLNKQLISLLHEHPELRQQQLSLLKDGTVDFILDFHCMVHPWPIFISDQQIASFDHIVKTMPTLFINAIKKYFGTDAQAFSKYLGWPASLYEVLINTLYDPTEVLIRYDTIYVDKQIKLIEANAGSNIGGWDHAFYSPICQNILKSHQHTKNWKYEHRNILENMLLHMIHSIDRIKGESAKGNILWISRNYFSKQDSFEDYMQHFYNQLKPKQYENGTIIFQAGYEHIKFSNDGDVIFNNKEIDLVAFSMLDYDAPPLLMHRLTAGYLMKKFAFVDNPLTTLLNSKFIFSILHELAIDKKLSDSEDLLVRNHIPWTSKLTREHTMWNKQEYLLKTLLLEHKNCFVLKKAHSYGGQDVIVGKYSSNLHWQQSLDQLIDNDEWLAQEYQQPDLHLSNNQQSTMSHYELVWGIFGTNNSYGGSFVRAVPTDSGNGVINSCNGATDIVIFEEC